MTFALYRKRITGVLLAVLIVLLLMHGVVVAGHLVFKVPWGALTTLFDVDIEANIPTLFNISLFVIASLLFYVVGRVAPKGGRWGWYLMAAVMGFLAVDEGSQIHERFMVFTLRLMNDGALGIGKMGWLFYAWIIPYVAAAMVLVAVLLPWFLRQDGRTRFGLFLAGAVYIAGAVMAEAYSGKVAEALLVGGAAGNTPGWLPCDVYRPGNCFLYGDARFVLITTLEEALEMLGLILCINVLAGLLDKARAGVRITFGDQATGPQGVA